MARFGFIGGFYTARSPIGGDEEAFNLFLETDESGGGQSGRTMYVTPGTSLFSAITGSAIRGGWVQNGRAFVICDATLWEVLADGSQLNRGIVANDTLPASFAGSNTQLCIVSGGYAYCYDLALNTLTDVTGQMLRPPVAARYCDGFFLVFNSRGFQFSGILDGTTWSGLDRIEVSVFQEDLVGYEVDHREVWLWSNKHAVAYQDTGSSNTFDVIPGSLVEHGSAATFAHVKADNSMFWLEQDLDGRAVARRMNGYTPTRVSTHAVEYHWQQFSRVDDAVAYTYQDQGHVYWHLYFPTANESWRYDVGEGIWSRVGYWRQGAYEAHHSMCHLFVFGKHIVGDWGSGELLQMSQDIYADRVRGGGTTELRWLRRAPVIARENQYIYHSELNVDLDPGLGPQPPLLDGNGNPRPPQIMVRWSDNRGKTWSESRVLSAGLAGDYKARARALRLGRSRYRVYEVSGSDPIPWAFADAYLLATGYDVQDRLPTKLRQQA